MRTRLEVFQRLDSRFRGNDKQGGNDEGDAFPYSPYPKLGLKKPEQTPAGFPLPPSPQGFSNAKPWQRGLVQKFPEGTAQHQASHQWLLIRWSP